MCSARLLTVVTFGLCVGGTAKLKTCALEKKELHRIMAALQQIVSELELGSFSNLDCFAADLDQRTEAILLTRLEELVELWMLCFNQDNVSDPARGAEDDAETDAMQPLQPSDYIRQQADAARSRLEIKVKNSVLVVDPPIEWARRTWLQQLSAQIGIIAEIPRIRHTTYSDFGEVKSERGDATHESLVHQFPIGVLRSVYNTIESRARECEKYVESWLAYQSLWDLEAAAVIARLGGDLADWLAVVTDLRCVHCAYMLR